MNEEILFEAMNDIDDRWLREAALPLSKPKAIWRRWIAAAACVMLVSAVTGYALCFTGVKYPTANAPCEAYQSPACWSTQYYDYMMLANEADAVVVADVVKSSLEEHEYWDLCSVASVKVREVLKGDVQQGDILTGTGGGGSFGSIRNRRPLSLAPRPIRENFKFHLMNHMPFAVLL